MTVWTWDERARAWTMLALPVDRPHALGPSASLIPFGDGRYGLLASGRTQVNGEPVLPVRALDDRDELRLADGSLRYVSVDDIPATVPFSGARPARCARCATSIEAGTLAVTCPRCHSVCHQTANLACWTHGDACPACSHTTRGLSWQPDPLAPRPADGETWTEDV